MPLMMSWGNVTDLMSFKEYSGIYDLGAYKLRSGIGNLIIGMTESNTAQGNFIFDRLIYASSLMIAAKSEGTYYGIAPDYMSVAFKPGPYTTPGDYDQETVHHFHKSFYVDKEMVYYHVAAIANNTPGYVIPKGILYWPAHGDPNKGQADFLAPFTDVNANNIYEPQLGEYPSFPGTHCLLNITHQHESDFLNEGLGIEMHNYVYNFDCEDTLQDVVFYKTEVFNRSNRNLDSLAIGLYNDFDIGNFLDDYVGTHVGHGLVYAYNGDNVDEDQNGMQGFHDSLPGIGNLFLKGVKMPGNGQDDQAGVSSDQTVNGYGFNDAVPDNEYKGLESSAYFSGSMPVSQSDPTSVQQNFNYLTGKWRFGDSLFYGGTGFSGSMGATTIRSKYCFPSDSDPLHYGTNGVNPGFPWDEMSNSNPPGDRRMIGSFGTAALNMGEKVEYHFAYLAGKRIPDMGESRTDLFARAAYAKNAFNSNLTSCGQTFGDLTEAEINFVPQKTISARVELYPNPADNKLTVKIPMKSTYKLVLTDINGKQILSMEGQNQISTLDVSTLQPGIYFIRVSSESLQETLKFVKN